MNDNEKVILVDFQNHPVEVWDKYDAHLSPGKLHRAVSVVLYRKSAKKIDLLIQKRSEIKKLWPGFWANTVCTHQKEGEQSKEAAVKRLKEELGIKISPELLVHAFDFVYKADYSDKLCEHEYDEVFVGLWHGEPKPQPDEVSQIEWIGYEKLLKDISDKSTRYTPWFEKIILNPMFEKFLK